MVQQKLVYSFYLHIHAYIYSYVCIFVFAKKDVHVYICTYVSMRKIYVHMSSQVEYDLLTSAEFQPKLTFNIYMYKYKLKTINQRIMYSYAREKHCNNKKNSSSHVFPK